MSLILVRTTGVACMNNGRKFIGIELDDNYFDIATKRILGEQQERDKLSITRGIPIDKSKS